MNVYRVSTRHPVYHSPYYVVAADFGEAERKVLEAENRDGADCQGVTNVELMSTYDASDEPNQFIGF